jgi:hypothetical protein
MPLQVRRGTNAERLTLSVPLAQGEPLWVTDDQKLYIGDGTTLAASLNPATGFNAEDAADAAAAALTNGIHTNISFFYDDVNNRINATANIANLLQNLNLNNFDIVGTGDINISGNIDVSGSITGDFKGSIFADNSVLLVDALDGKINLDGTVKGDIIPNVNEAYDIGSASFRFKDLYLSGTSLYLGSAQLTATGSAINLPVGSTVDGLPISAIIPGSNYNINIVGDDSTVLVNTATNTIQGTFDGDITGSVFALDSSLMVDAIDRIFYGTIDTGESIFATNSITSTSVNQFQMGTEAVPMELNLNLVDNLRIKQTVGAFTNGITMQKGRGTLLSPAAIQPDDVVGGLLCLAYTDGSTLAEAGTISVVIDSTAVIAGGNFVKSKLVLAVASDTSADEADAFILDSAGLAVSNAFEASKYFQLPVYANDAARLTAIPTPAAGMMIFMTSGTTPAATNQMQVFDGTNWVNAS